MYHFTIPRGMADLGPTQAGFNILRGSVWEQGIIIGLLNLVTILSRRMIPGMLRSEHYFEGSTLPPPPTANKSPVFRIGL